MTVNLAVSPPLIAQIATKVFNRHSKRLVPLNYLQLSSCLQLPLTLNVDRNMRQR